MNIILGLIDFIFHIDEHLFDIIHIFGIWSYAILFLIVFIETGVVIFPFLPGDSLLFAGGAFAAVNAFHFGILVVTFFIAAVIGDTVNYHIGKKAGMSISSKSWLGKIVDQNKMNKAESFFHKHGGKTIVFARFMPFIRTFAPFIAGASRMRYPYFMFYNIIGGASWVSICTVMGYLFGNIAVIKNNFSIVLLMIIVISVFPAFITFMKNKLGKQPV